jgi:hypothetical protein
MVSRSTSSGTRARMASIPRYFNDPPAWRLSSPTALSLPANPETCAWRARGRLFC